MEFPESFLPVEQTMIGHLGMTITACDRDHCTGTLPIDHRTVQVAGVAHGGALIALAETLASVGTFANVDAASQFCVGQEINASLLRPGLAGTIVHGAATVLHRGRSSMVWDVRIVNPEQKLVAVCRCTIAIRPLEK